MTALPTQLLSKGLHMYDIVGYSGTFVSGYRGRNISLKDHHTSITPDDRPWYRKIQQLILTSRNIEVTLHTELFLRPVPYDMWRSTPVYRYRLLVEEVLLLITDVESKFRLSLSSVPDEKRLITPEGTLIFHSKQERYETVRYTTWQDQKLWPIVEHELHPNRCRQ